ncbi:MAG: hypothetical protein ACO1OB_23795 [Archangium sp.]
MATVDGDSTSERAARELIGKLGQGDSVEVKLTAELKMEESAGLDGTAKIIREGDGSVTVELEADVKIGLGSNGADGKIGIGAGTKLHFATAAEAADFLDAFAKAGAMTYVSTSASAVSEGAKQLGFKNSWTTAHERLAKHLGKIVEVKGDAIAEAKIAKSEKTYGFDAISAKAGLKAKSGFKLDFEKGTVSRTYSFAVDASADMKLPLLKANGAGKVTVTVSETYKLSKAELAAVKGGGVTPDLLLTNLWSRTASETTIKAEVEVSQKGSLIAAEDTKVKFTLEKKTDFTKDNFKDVLLELGRLEWKGEVDIGLGTAAGGDISLGDERDGKLSAEASVKYRHKESLQGERSLTAWIPVLKQRADDNKLVDGLRASAGL